MSVGSISFGLFLVLFVAGVMAGWRAVLGILILLFAGLIALTF